MFDAAMRSTTATMTRWANAAFGLCFLTLFAAATVLPGDDPDSTGEIMKRLPARAAHRHDFCIIGAGPGGIQAAYFMQRLGMNYVVLESGTAPGTFFKRYPRHLQLLSVNKVHIGGEASINGRNKEAALDYHLRYDWNSLLTSTGIAALDARLLDEPAFTFRNYSEAYYPHADDLVRYLGDFAKRHRLRVLYSTRVTAVYEREEETGGAGDESGEHGHAAEKAASSSSRFVLLAHPQPLPQAKSPPSSQEGAAEEGFTVQCGVVVLATGTSIPRQVVAVDGAQHIEQCGEVPTDAVQYTNQRLFILGGGNSAFELAQAVESRAASVHVASRRPVRFAFQSRYEGDPRSSLGGMLDRYQLKSNDAILSYTHFIALRPKFSMEEVAEFMESKMKRNPAATRFGVGPVHVFRDNTTGGRLYVVIASDAKQLRLVPQGPGFNVSRFVAQRMSDHDAGRQGYDRIIQCLGYIWDNQPFAPDATRRFRHSQEERQRNDEGVMDERAFMATERNDDPYRGEQADDLEVASRWRKAFVARDETDTYPEVTSAFESVSTPHLYVAGALMHFRDHKRSAGGFIHGFRYLVRTLVWQLRERYQRQPTEIMASA